jgi:hypothetical protein
LKRAWVGLGKPLQLAARCRNCRYRPPEVLSGDQTKTSEAEAVVTEAITPACRKHMPGFDAIMRAILGAILGAIFRQTD